MKLKFADKLGSLGQSQVPVKENKMSCITFHPDDSLEGFISEPHIRPSKGDTLHYTKWWHEVGSEPRCICAAVGNKS